MQNIHSPMRTALWSLVVLTVIAFVFGAAYQFEQWRVMRQGKSQLLVQAASMDTLFQQYAVTPRLLMTDPRLITLLRGKGEVGEANNQEANAILKNAAGVGNLAEVFLMDERGVTVAASNSETEVSFVGKSYGFRPYFQGAIQGEQTTFFRCRCNDRYTRVFHCESTVPRRSRDRGSGRQGRATAVTHALA